MSLMQRIAGGLVVAAIAVGAMAADRPAAAERKFPLEDGGQVVLQWHEGWSVTAPPPNSPPGSVAFQQADGTKMRAVLIPMIGMREGTSEHANLRVVTLRMASELAKQPNSEVSKEPVSFEGPYAHGHYVTGIDRQPKPNEYSFIHSGFVGVGKESFMFNVVWNEGGDASAKALLEAVKGMRVEAN
jgi:hypothetical protein